MPFLSSLLISLYYKSIKEVSCNKTNIFIGSGYLINILIEVKWFSIIGFLVIKCFKKYFKPHFTAGLVDF